MSRNNDATTLMPIPQASTPGGWELENFRENALFWSSRKVDNYIPFLPVSSNTCNIFPLIELADEVLSSYWSSNVVYGRRRQKGGHRHNLDNESIQCERQKLWFLCPSFRLDSLN